MQTDEANVSQSPTAPQQQPESPQIKEGESPVDPDRTGPQPGDSDHPGDAPDEIDPTPDSDDQPGANPDEIEPLPDDRQEPGSSPDEIPADLTMLPPD
ncbi:hypothetical protein [Aurantiacibacter zhengii]|uniref:Uncharacterized protein n=1 Tax=Aurantiacibacter zhengii TaxID=2307003 RepID=A0A418NUU6_9SPHN|nr:hypothetical protein [Aurantiacibacter zhengii]RIV87932.1 hypothetical protein D2V07_06360 [Aurantiacibacter zhengii]